MMRSLIEFFLKKQEGIYGDFTKHKPIRILEFKKLVDDNKTDNLLFKLEWENNGKENIKETFYPISTIKKECPLILCEFYEKFINFKKNK